MTDITGKKLLILGASSHEAALVRRAKELGVYTIVTDYYKPEHSPAKKIADEYWNISWSDIDSLEKKCKKCAVDGVTAGYSEFTVESMIKLCSRLNLPSYITEKQLEITRNKILFKEECRKNCVPVIKEYASPATVDTFPVIVKPVDRSGSIGISIATNKEELLRAYDYAMEMSVCKKVIIEEFITKGTKFDAVYAITNGNIAMIGTQDTINAASNGTERVVQSAWLTPSKYHQQFLVQEDAHLQKMIRSMGIRDGLIFFSGFVKGNSYSFFECGYRLPGGHMYAFGEAKGMPNAQDIFIYHALTGNTEHINFNCVANENLKGIMLNFYAKAGVFSHFFGMDAVEKLDTCNLCLPFCTAGKECHDDKAILTKLSMFHFYHENPLILAEAAKEANQNFSAISVDGQDMIYDRINTEIIKTWWD